MLFRQVDLTTALRPCLLPEEALLGVYDSVGLYRDRFKIDTYQDGQLYSTSHRIIYVDNQDARQYSVSIDLKDVDHADLSAGFLRSSPKITLFPKPQKPQSLAYRPTPGPSHSWTDRATPGRLRDINAVWICPICSFSNQVPSHFDPSTANEHTTLAPCSTCGIVPPVVHVVKATIAALSRENKSDITSGPAQATDPTTGGNICPQCTFVNHASLRTCEICGAALARRKGRTLIEDIQDTRVPSPGPSTSSLSSPATATETVRLSFRAGNEKVAFDRIKNALIQRKWLLENAPSIATSEATASFTPNNTLPTASPVKRQVGVAGLEGRGFNARLANQTIIGHAFDDLEALMTSAKEVIAMAERFATQTKTGSTEDDASKALLSESASALGLVATKDMFGTGKSPANDSLYITQLSRDLAEYLTDDKRGLLRREGGIISLVDLWAVFNRSRNGIELISPADFEKAAQTWEQLRLPIRLRQFKSGLLVVQGRDRTDEKTVASLLKWLERFCSDENQASIGTSIAVTWDWHTFGRGVTAQDTATEFGWSVGVATEELEMAEDRGVLVREQGAEGIRFWLNRFPDVSEGPF